MAVITPTLSVSSVPRVSWSSIDNSSTFEPWVVYAQFGLAGAIQISGTFGGATIALIGSNDNVTFFPILDLQGSAVSATANKLSEFTTSVAFLKLSITGGSGTSVNAVMALRGSSSAD